MSGEGAVKQLTVISGKGGTGKTTLVAAFASLAQRAVLADCDVDAADLHLILRPDVLERSDFRGLRLAEIDPEKCTECGACREHCRFLAIDERIHVVEERCEGCGVCGLVCPAGAVRMVERSSGVALISRTRFGPMAHAELEPGGEASGKLVSLVLEKARELARAEGRGLIIVDGPPGTGCPVIASLGGASLALLVTEPTPSGHHDLERAVGVCEHFGVQAMVCINKHDLNKENTRAIQEWCAKRGLELAGLLPYSDAPVRAMMEERTVVESDPEGFGRRVREVWRRVSARLGTG
ncbi:MAG: ATP-binding protein [Thermoplasmatota archaeon]